MDATELLRREHRYFRGLFACYAKLDPTDTDRKRAIFEHLRRTVGLHLRLEEELFYPAVKETPTPEAEASLEAPLDNHSSIGMLLSELAALRVDDRRFDVLMKALRQDVERHIRGGERSLFTEARRSLSRKCLQKLGAEMRARAAFSASPALGG